MTSGQFEPIADTTRRAEIVGRLRQAILSGKMKPGQKINELRIAEQMHVSRAPLREAIRELVQEGLLTNIPYAGAFVINVTAKDVEEAYSFHHALEDFAIDRVWASRDARFAAELDLRHEAVKRATMTRDLTRQIESALRLHGLIYEWSNHALLLDTWQRLVNRLQMYFALHQHARDEPVPDVHIHEDYVRLLKGDDIAAAKRHAHEHLDWNFEELLAYVRQLEGS